MKIAILAAALLGTAAVAQTTSDTGTAGQDTTGQTGTMQQDMTTQTGMPGETSPGQTTGPMAPSGANQPLNAPAGARVVINPDQQSAFAPRPAAQEYPPCGRGVTDGCVQTNERGMRRPGRR